MKSRQLVFKTSLIVWPSVQQFRLSLNGLIAVSCLLALASDSVAQRPVFVPSSEGSLPAAGQAIEASAAVVPMPIVAQPIQEQSNQPNSVLGAVESGDDLIAKPVDGPESTVEARQIAEEINSIRRQLGGGLAQHLGEITNADSQAEESLEASFQNELNRLARESKRQPDRSIGQVDALRERIGQTTEPYSQPVRSDSIFQQQPLYQTNSSQPSRSLERVAFGNSGSGSPASNPADQLRGAARALDQMASQFETSGLYEEADQVRAQAQRFWLKSRLFQNRSGDR